MIRILFVSDTHLGFDLPHRPRVERRRRGPDFFRNFELALEPARRGEVDVVVHGGDILYRSKVRAELVAKAFRPLKEIADRDVSVYLVPGNHERSHIPYGLLAEHENVHVFDRPRTFVYEKEGFVLALAGFPYVRGVRKRFAATLATTKWSEAGANGSLLLIHHAVEGAQVGPKDFTFRDASDVIRAADLPRGLLAVLSGHIHRAQALTEDIDGRPLSAPVLYPGSVERTSFAEKDETKGYLTLGIETKGPDAGRLRGWRFHRLPARPMVQIDLSALVTRRRDLRAWLERKLASLPPDSVVQLRVEGDVPEALRAAALRAMAPATMNISLRLTAKATENLVPPHAGSACRRPATAGD